jgi:hypothetical protein
MNQEQQDEKLVGLWAGMGTQHDGTFSNVTPPPPPPSPRRVICGEIIHIMSPKISGDRGPLRV